MGTIPEFTLKRTLSADHQPPYEFTAWNPVMRPTLLWAGRSQADLPLTFQWHDAPLVCRVGWGSSVSNVIQFPGPEPELDLFIAVEFAIRDLRDIAGNTWGQTRLQADECRRMLERALRAAPLDEPSLHQNPES
jgi:hypothetical protein